MLSNICTQFFWTNLELFRQEISLSNITSKKVNHTKKFIDQGFSPIELIPKKERVTKKEKKNTSHRLPTEVIEAVAKKKVEHITT